MEQQLKLKAVEGLFSVCHLDSGSNLPKWALQSPWVTITKTEEEVSVVCETTYVPEAVQSEADWRMLKVIGVLDFSLVGILSKLTGILAEACISVFAVSTFDTDYLMVKRASFVDAVEAFNRHGITVIDGL